ncbi:MAG: hypothetical protein ACKO0M_00700, partial [Cyanobium sp.]
MSLPNLGDLEAEARQRDLLLRLQVARPVGIWWSLRIAVARRRGGETGFTQPVGTPCRPPDDPDQARGAVAGGALVLLGDLRAWALPGADGLHIDSLQVAGRQRHEPDLGVGPLITAACFAWALEATPCRRARFLAIRDDARQHRRLVRYFRRLGFEPLREVGSAPQDLPAR